MHVSVHNTTTHYQQIGSGLPLVLLHGWGCDWQIWSTVIPTLSDTFELIIPDIPLFGNSTLNDPTTDSNAWDSFEYANWLEEFVSKVIPGSKYAIIGHSFGGKIATIHAARQPELLTGLVIVDASGLPEKLTSKEQLTQRISHLIPSPIKQLVGKTIKQKVLQSFGVASDYQDANLAQQAVLKKIVREDISHQLAQITLPSLVVWGKQDSTTPLAKGELFAELLQSATLEVFDQAGHYPFIDNPQRFSSVVQSYCSKQFLDQQ